MSFPDVIQKGIDYSFYATHPEVIAIVAAAFGVTITVCLLVTADKLLKLLCRMQRVRKEK